MHAVNPRHPNQDLAANATAQLARSRAATRAPARRRASAGTIAGTLRLARQACGAAVLAAAASAQDFRAVEPNLCKPPTVEVAADATRRFGIVDGELRVIAPPAPTALPATSPTGCVREIAAMPWGTIVAACDGGLFVCDAEHAVLDRADTRDGVVEGALVGLAVDAQGRLWLCSRDAFGVVDLRLRFGRVFTAADGVPAPPYRDVSIGEDGSVLLLSETGAHAYRPDAAEAPSIRQSPGDGAVLTATPDGSLPLSIDVAARGGAHLRIRRRHHHLLTPLGPEGLTGLRPGRHGIEVHAFDRDLRHAVVGTFHVQVPLPPQLDPRIVLVALAVLAVLLLWSARRASPPGTSAARWWWAATRAAAAAIVLLQIGAAFAGYGRSWPFVGFSMYTENWHRDDVIYRPRVLALRADGDAVPLDESRLGLAQDGYWQMLAEVVFGNATERDRLWQRIGWSAPPGAPFRGFVIVDTRIRLTAAGPVDVAPTLLMEYRP